MKWDFAIGNPAYQAAADESSDNKTYSAPVYNLFLDEAFKVADKVEMIHPARFLFNAGSTPKEWNEKMLNDPHFKVLDYEEDAKKVFGGTDIKGGVAITYHDNEKEFGAIEIFTKHPSLNSILKKAMPLSDDDSLISIIYIQNRLNLSKLLKEYPELKNQIGSDGRDSRFEKNIFVKIPLFTETGDSNSIKTLGIFCNKREWRYISSKYVDLNHENLKKYKVVIPVANGSGEFGQTLSMPVLEKPNEAFTRSFIGIGAFNSKAEANSALKYIKTKFCRVMLSILKVTQMTNKDVWKYVPLQDFTNKSDIDWSASIANIDKQLYKKYGLSKEEIDFIESHVKEME